MNRHLYTRFSYVKKLMDWPDRRSPEDLTCGELAIIALLYWLILIVGALVITWVNNFSWVS